MQPRTRSRWSIVGVVGLLALLAVQGIVDFRSPVEAFPTVSMPSFEGAPDATGHRTLTKLTIEITYADGSTRTPAVERLFAPFHNSSARFAVDHLFLQDPELDRDTVDWLREQSTLVGDGAAPVLLRFTWQQYDFDVRQGSGTAIGQPKVTEIDL